MAASSQVYQNKRGRDEYWNGGLALSDAKRTNGGFTLAHDSDLMQFLDKIDDMDNNNNNPENTHAVNQVEEVRQFDEKRSSHQMDSTEEVELIDGNSEVISSVYDRGDMAYYDDFGAEFGFFVDHFTPHELGIITNHYHCDVDGDSMPDILYSAALYGYAAETSEVVYGFLWEDDIWQWNEHPVIQNDFATPQQGEFGVNGTEFHDVWNDIRPIQL